MTVSAKVAHPGQPEDQLATLFGKIRVELLLRSQNGQIDDPSPESVDCMIQALDIMAARRGVKPAIWLLNTMKLLARTGEIVLSPEQADHMMLQVYVPDLADA